MNDIEAVEKRCSRRSFIKGKIDFETIEKLLKEISSKSNIRFELIKDGLAAFKNKLKTMGMFSGVESLIAVIIKKDNLEDEEKAGYYTQKIALELVKMNLGSCFVAGTYDKNKLDINLKEDEFIRLVLPFGNVTNKEDMSTKEAFIFNKIHKKDKPYTFQIESSKKDFPKWFTNGMKAVEKAPSALNRRPVIFKYKNENEVYAYVKDKKEYIDLGIAKLNFEIGSGMGTFETGNNAKFILK